MKKINVLRICYWCLLIVAGSMMAIVFPKWTSRMENFHYGTADERKHRSMLRAVYQCDKDGKKLEKIEQKPAWSEEDESNISELCSFITESYNKEDASELRQWLKSLRPQNKWKPSDEQMSALKEACDEHWEPDGLDPLYTLYQYLKKLREEYL